jgi:DNA-binding response OmpR family regulator
VTKSLAHILLIEGRGGASHSFAPALRSKDYEVTIARTGRRARHMLTRFRPDVIVMDTSHSRSNGVRICTMLRTAAPRVPLIYISPSDRPRPTTLRADIFLVQPFTVRKLVNRIKRLLPSAEGPVLESGPLSLNTEKRSLNRNHRDHRLTPKQAHLLEVLMRHPGQVLSRRHLMKTVWQTDFMDDTRTLDVHIRWVREAIEENPSKPRYLITIRGKGYRFAIPADESQLQR